MRFTRTYKFNVVDHLGKRAISLHMQFDPVGGVDLSIHNITLLRAKNNLEGKSFPVWRGHQIVVPVPAAHVEGQVFTVTGVRLEGEFLGREDEFRALVSVVPGRPYRGDGAALRRQQ